MMQEKHDGGAPSLNRIAFKATAHCLAGCSIGEVLGMVIGAALKWENWPTVALSIVLAFIFGYLMTLSPLLKAKMKLGTAIMLALAADTLSITIMEIIDNGVMLVIPDAMSAGVGQPIFWFSLFISLVLAGLAAFPANRWLISRGRGHALVKNHHHMHH
ncbi:MAG: DUF4396 domain-containing protein [Planctomycetes bacterium]|nr:DUF4396 domain-containing protein [Planctomycetota bacterium]